MNQPDPRSVFGDGSKLQDLMQNHMQLSMQIGLILRNSVLKHEVFKTRDEAVTAYNVMAAANKFPAAPPQQEVKDSSSYGVVCDYVVYYWEPKGN